MKRLLTLAVVAAALVAVAAFAGVGRPEAASGDTGTPDTVTTNGHGVVTVVPDEATITAGVHTQASLPVLVQLQAPAWHAAIAVLKHAALDAPERPAAATSSEHALWPQAGAASALETVNGRPAPRASTPNAKNIFLASI